MNIIHNVKEAIKFFSSFLYLRLPFIIINIILYTKKIKNQILKSNIMKITIKNLI